MRTRAFSLIELLVVIAIIMILSVSVLASIRPSSDQARMDEVANDVVSLLREARRNSMAIMEHPNYSGLYPAYGINFNAVTVGDHSGNIIRYAACDNLDTNNSGSLEYTDRGFHLKPGDTVCGNRTLQVVPLKHGVRVTEIRYEGSRSADSGTYTHFNVLFVPPEPTIWFAARNSATPPPSIGAGAIPGGHTVLDVGTVYIKIENAPRTLDRTISVNSVGRVAIEQ